LLIGLEFQKSVENEEGHRNNLVSVRESDFEVFQALAKDSENVTNYAEKEYSQEVPQVKPWEKVSGPPVLPPHLLQVILNKDTPLSVGIPSIQAISFLTLAFSTRSANPLCCRNPTMLC